MILSSFRLRYVAAGSDQLTLRSAEVFLELGKFRKDQNH